MDRGDPLPPCVQAWQLASIGGSVAGGLEPCLVRDEVRLLVWIEAAQGAQRLESSAKITTLFFGTRGREPRRRIVSLDLNRLPSECDRDVRLMCVTKCNGSRTVLSESAWLTPSFSHRR